MERGYYHWKMVVKSQIGQHTFEADGDLIIIRNNGPFTLSDMKEFYTLVRGRTERGRVYVLTDITHGGGVTPEARRYAANEGGLLRIEATAVYGKNLLYRTLLTMTLRAAALVGKATVNDIAFFATEAEARAYLQKVRDHASGAE